MNICKPCPGRTSAFTLVEMLVVLAIMAILALIALPAISGMMRSYQLDSTGQTVLNQLSLARQTALSRAHSVQVRLYFLPDYNKPPTSAPAVYRGLQCFLESDPTASGTTVTPVTKPFFFASPVVVLNNTSQSTMLTLNSSPADSANAISLPVYNSNYSYKIFRFTPSGQTFPSNIQICLTLAFENAAALSSGLPADFQTLQVDPLHGGIRSFRP